MKESEQLKSSSNVNISKYIIDIKSMKIIKKSNENENDKEKNYIDIINKNIYNEGYIDHNYKIQNYDFNQDADKYHDDTPMISFKYNDNENEKYYQCKILLIKTFYYKIHEQLEIFLDSYSIDNLDKESLLICCANLIFCFNKFNVVYHLDHADTPIKLLKSIMEELL